MKSFMKILESELEEITERIIEFPTEEEAKQYVQDNNLIEGQDYEDKGSNGTSYLLNILKED